MKIKSLQYRIIIELVLFFLHCIWVVLCARDQYATNRKRFSEGNTTKISVRWLSFDKHFTILAHFTKKTYSGLFSHLPCSTKISTLKAESFSNGLFFLGKSEIRVAWQQRVRVWTGGDDSGKNGCPPPLSFFCTMVSSECYLAFFIHPLLLLLW